MDVLTATTAKKVAFLWIREGGAAITQIENPQFYSYAAKAGLDIVYKAEVSIAQPDFTSEALQARQAGAQVVVFLSDYPSGIRFARSAHNQGWHPPIVGPWNWYVTQLPGGADSDGFITQSSLVTPYSIASQMKPYLDAVNRYEPGAPTGGIGADGWAAGKLLEAIAPSLGDHPTRADIFKGLYSLRGETLGGIVPPLTFPQGPHDKVNLCTLPVVWSAKEGKWNAPIPNTYFCMLDNGTLQRHTVKW
jgi:branched-chain amino acid transport system substrate-binding protein